MIDLPLLRRRCLEDKLSAGLLTGDVFEFAPRATLRIVAGIHYP